MNCRVSKGCGTVQSAVGTPRWMRNGQCPWGAHHDLVGRNIIKTNGYGVKQGVIRARREIQGTTGTQERKEWSLEKIEKTSLRQQHFRWFLKDEPKSFKWKNRKDSQQAGRTRGKEYRQKSSYATNVLRRKLRQSCQKDVWTETTSKVYQ